MNWINRTFVVLILLGLGFGTGLRANRRPQEPLKPEPVQTPAQKPDPSRSSKPAVEDRAMTHALVSEQVMDAIAQVESGGNPKAVGDSGRAVGLFQIWPIYVREANRLSRASQFTDPDRLDPVKSREMTRIVLEHWAKYHQSHGRHIGPAEICSIHRHPNASWRPTEMDSQHEQNRTKKLLDFMAHNK